MYPGGKNGLVEKKYKRFLQVSWTVNGEKSIPLWNQQLFKIRTLICVYQSFHISPLHLHTGKTTHSTEGEGRGAIMINNTLILFTSILRSYLTLSISAPHEEQNAVTLKNTALLLAFFTSYLIQYPLTGEAGAIAQGTAALVTVKIDCFSYVMLINTI